MESTLCGPFVQHASGFAFHLCSLVFTCVHLCFRIGELQNYCAAASSQVAMRSESHAANKDTPTGLYTRRNRLSRSPVAVEIEAHSIPTERAGQAI